VAELLDSSTDEFVDVGVGEEVGLGRWIGSDRCDPGAVGSLSVQLAEVVASGSKPPVVSVSVVMTAANRTVVLVGRTMIVPLVDVIDLRPRLGHFTPVVFACRCEESRRVGGRSREAAPPVAEIDHQASRIDHDPPHPSTQRCHHHVVGQERRSGRCFAANPNRARIPQIARLVGEVMAGELPLERMLICEHVHRCGSRGVVVGAVVGRPEDRQHGIEPPLPIGSSKPGLGAGIRGRPAFGGVTSELGLDERLENRHHLCGLQCRPTRRRHVDATEARDGGSPPRLDRRTTVTVCAVTIRRGLPPGDAGLEFVVAESAGVFEQQPDHVAQLTTTPRVRPGAAQLGGLLDPDSAGLQVVTDVRKIGDQTSEPSVPSHRALRVVAVRPQPTGQATMSIIEKHTATVDLAGNRPQPGRHLTLHQLQLAEPFRQLLAAETIEIGHHRSEAALSSPPDVGLDVGALDHVDSVLNTCTRSLLESSNRKMLCRLAGARSDSDTTCSRRWS
jgi:hypothetical protein